MTTADAINLWNGEWALAPDSSTRASEREKDSHREFLCHYQLQDGRTTHCACATHRRPGLTDNDQLDRISTEIAHERRRLFSWPMLHNHGSVILVEFFPCSASISLVILERRQCITLPQTMVWIFLASLFTHTLCCVVSQMVYFVSLISRLISLSVATCCTNPLYPLVLNGLVDNDRDNQHLVRNINRLKCHIYAYTFKQNIL